MNPQVFILLVLTLCGCAKDNPAPPVEHKNLHLNARELNGFLKGLRERYKMHTRTKRYLRGGPEYMKKGLTETRYWFFKTKKPVKRDTSGAWHHRFSVTRNTYRKLKYAQRAFQKTLAEFKKEKPPQGKGNVQILLLASMTIYSFQTDCYMNRHLDTVFQLFTKHLMGGRGPDKGSLLRHFCGGSHSLK